MKWREGNGERQRETERERERKIVRANGNQEDRKTKSGGFSSIANHENDRRKKNGKIDKDKIELTKE